MVCWVVDTDTEIDKPDRQTQRREEKREREREEMEGRKERREREVLWFDHTPKCEAKTEENCNLWIEYIKRDM